LAYVKHDHDAIPVLRMMRLSKEEIGARAEGIAQKVRSQKWSVDVIDGESVIGGGAAPSATLPTRLLAISHRDYSADALAERLRTSVLPVIGRVEEGRVLLDLRTVFPEQDEAIVKAFREVDAG
jgi:L-seryl-tRNA(Ser) seleniumtransferase